MPFAVPVPMVWKEPTNHANDCYFCMTPPIGHGISKKKKRSVTYPIIPSAMRPVPHGEELPVPSPPGSYTLDDGDSVTSEASSPVKASASSDPDFVPAEESVEPHKITQSELNDLVRDLELPKRKAELLGSRLQQWNLLQVNVQVIVFVVGKKIGNEKAVETLIFFTTMLSWCTRLCYGIGHFYNDLAAAMWFTYLIVYLQFVLCFDASVAGFVLLVGQVADAVATPLLGYETDNIIYLSFCKKYGRRKFLHLSGTLCVLFSFPFIFIECPGFQGASQWAKVVYLVPLVVIFQVGWAAVQVSHLALIPVITDDSSERDLLNVLRNAFDAVADVTVFVIAWVIFIFITSGPRDPLSIAADDRTKFMMIVLILTGIGCVFSAIFHLGVKEKTDETFLAPTSPTYQSTLTWRQWLREKQFYQMAALYTLARLFQNFCSVFIPLYLQESLKAKQDFMAKIPLLIHVTGFIASIIANYLIKVFGKKITLIIGATVGVGGCVWIGFGEGVMFCSVYIYIVSTFLGVGSNILVVCSLTLIPDLIGTSVESGTFVYGTMSFFDKLTNGIVILIIQYAHKLVCVQCDWYYRHVMSYGLGGIGVTFVIVLLTLFGIKFGERNREFRDTRMRGIKDQNSSVYVESNMMSDDVTQPLLGGNLSTIRR